MSGLQPKRTMSGRLGLWLIVLLVVGVQFLPPLIAAQGAAPNENLPAAEAAGAPQSEGQQTESGLHWFLRSSGFIGLFIFMLSVYFVALVIRLFFHMRPEIEVPQAVVTGCRDLIAQRNLQGVYDLARESDSFFGRVLARGIEQLANGLMDARHAMERAGEVETVRMEKQISMMAVLGTLGPMIGLIGTLKGMIASFSVIAMSGVTLKASEVAGGISEALLLTFEGVSLSVPAIYFYAFFRNRVAAISAEAMLEADNLLQSFFRSTRSKGGASAPATPRPPQ
jgi:biopolymer transport protein ExbB